MVRRCNWKALLVSPGLFEGTLREGATCPASGKAAPSGLGWVGQQGIRHIVLLHFLLLHLSGLVRKVNGLVGDKCTAHAEEHAPSYTTGRTPESRFAPTDGLCSTNWSYCQCQGSPVTAERGHKRAHDNSKPSVLSNVLRSSNKWIIEIWKVR